MGDVKKVALDKILDGKPHGVAFDGAILFIPAIAENDMAVFDGQDAFVGNGAAPDIARQIGQNALAIGRGASGIDIPFDPPRRLGSGHVNLLIFKD